MQQSENTEKENLKKYFFWSSYKKIRISALLGNNNHHKDQQMAVRKMRMHPFSKCTSKDNAKNTYMHDMRGLSVNSLGEGTKKKKHMHIYTYIYR